MEEKIICSYCNKKIIPFKARNDWITRKYHLKCWQMRFDDFIREEMQEQYKD